MYTIYGKQAPLGTRSISRYVYNALDRLLSALRAKLWAMRTGLSPDKPTERFDMKWKFSFKAFEKLRFAPSVVFRARKVAGTELDG